MDKIRLFDTHKIRRTELLNGLWEFKGPYHLEGQIKVPMCWEEMPCLTNYRGKICYKKCVKLDKTSNIRIFFEGVGFFCKVYLDNNFLGKHYGAYTAFSVTAKGVSKGEHTITVIVSNKFSFKSAIHIQNDYYSYGGITRGLQMEYIPDTYLDSIGLIPSKDENGWKLKIKAIVKSLTGDLNNYSLIANLDGKDYDLGAINDNGITESEIIVGNKIKPWSPESPNLYEVQVKLVKNGQILDDLIERTGFRVVKYNKEGLFVNDKKYYLLGVNRHEDYDFHGSSIPLELQINDINIIKEMGANAIRTCHYPNDSRFLDLCDENGLLVWEESHARGLGDHQMKNPYFKKQLHDCGEEMVRWHVSHPSIIIWGCLNECVDFKKYGAKIYKQHISELKSYDQSRPITFASCKPFKNLAMGYEDVISYNLYYNWYKLEKQDDEFPRILKWIDDLGYQDKPMIMSEFGASSLYGLHEDTPKTFYTEEYQALAVKKDIEYYSKCDKIVGLFIWQYCDGRVCENHFKKRPNGINSKGLVTTKREKKLAYYSAQEMYKKLAKERNK